MGRIRAAPGHGSVTLHAPRRPRARILAPGHTPSGATCVCCPHCAPPPCVLRGGRRSLRKGVAVRRVGSGVSSTRAPRDVDVVVIGAGQAGLSTAWALARQGFEPETGFVVLDGDDGPGGAWQHRWPSLTVGTTHRVHDLPGLAFEPAGESLRAADVVPAYFAEYERRFALPVHRPVRVRAVSPHRRRPLPRRDRRRRLDGARDRQRDRHLDPAVRAPLPRPGAVPRPPAAHRRLPRRRRVRRSARRRRRRRGVGHAAARRDLDGRRHHLGDPPAAGLARGPVRRGRRAGGPSPWSRRRCGRAAVPAASSASPGCSSPRPTSATPSTAASSSACRCSTASPRTASRGTDGRTRAAPT